MLPGWHPSHSLASKLPEFRGWMQLTWQGLGPLGMGSARLVLFHTLWLCSISADAVRQG
jgi:hypothetical protein